MEAAAIVDPATIEPFLRVFYLFLSRLQLIPYWFEFVLVIRGTMERTLFSVYPFAYVFKRRRLDEFGVAFVEFAQPLAR